MVDLIDWMRDSYRKQEDNKPKEPQISYIERFERIKKIPVLAIDEIDKARNTEFADEFLFNFLDERYRSACDGQTMTLFASNLHPKTMHAHIFDRLDDGRFYLIENTAGSARPYMR